MAHDKPKTKTRPITEADRKAFGKATAHARPGGKGISIKEMRREMQRDAFKRATAGSTVESETRRRIGKSIKRFDKDMKTFPKGFKKVR